MTRVLDIDLDFFVHGVGYYRGPDDDRLDEEAFPPWSVDDAMAFLEDRCGLTGPLPGFVVENHGDVFAMWRDEIEHERWTTPFHVTHVDAHADLGLGDAGYVYLMTDLLFAEPADRTHPDGGTRGLGDGNFLAFAVACRWLSDLVYVHNDEGGNDVPALLMENADVHASHLELKAVTAEALDQMMFTPTIPEVSRFEPKVPFAQLRWHDFQSTEPYDSVCLCRSPSFTPPGSDVLFEQIRQRFVDEGARS